MRKIKILWADDEIDLLKMHIFFLQEKGYEVVTANNGDDAISFVHENHFDIIFLDEHMPGLSGLETLDLIKSIYPTIPIVMVTKSEEEDIMDRAIGAKIADYLIKPVNPKQILLAIKKNVDTKRLITQKTTRDYQMEFSKISMRINQCNDFLEWAEIYKKLVFWELEIEQSGDNTMDEVIKLQKDEANHSFAKFIKRNYAGWFTKEFGERPLLPIDIFKKKIFPALENEQVVMIIIDNLRFDQWKILQPVIREFYQLEEETIYSSILPTATQYARNAMFAGLMPSDIVKHYPDLWISDEEEGSKNLNEELLLENQIKRLGMKYKFYYDKILNNKAGEKLVENLSSVLENQLAVIVFNFVDMLSHARTEMQMIRELTNDEAAYRSLTLTWFEHSSLLSLLKELSNRKIKVVITTDHGTIRVSNPIKIVGDKKITTNLRYKQGKNLNYKQKEVCEINNPEDIMLPKSFLSSKYVFATNKDFFAYPNNYNYYVNYFKNTFQHGGISLEEMLIPLIVLNPKPL
ncbi:MAG: two-component system response regulator [Bacteroidetes bacterium 4572_117]|nr:MAG: two-component system response regulator [Bacteroidetes bacterium 4572_117]